MVGFRFFVSFRIEQDDDRITGEIALKGSS